MLVKFSTITTLISIAIALLLVAFISKPVQPLPAYSYSGFNHREPVYDIQFVDNSLNWGIANVHHQSSKHLTALTETMGSGICVFDFNKDGWIDIFFIGGSGHARYYGKKSWWDRNQGNRLLMNVEGKHFRDVSKNSGIEMDTWGMGCAVADFNNDSLDDLLLTTLDRNFLYQNLGEGKFRVLENIEPLDRSVWSTSAAIGDFNNDNLPDIYISNYIRYKKGAKTFERRSGFQVANSAFDPTLYDPEPNQLLLNKGNFVFEDITESSGVSNSQGRSIGSRWIHLNNDQWLDLIVLNDKGTPNQLFINQQGKRFLRGNDSFASFEVSGSHSLLVQDFNNDGHRDYFMSRASGLPHVLIEKEKRKFLEPTPGYGDYSWERHLAQTRLLPLNSWGASSGDFNNDGHLDIYVANGLTSADIDTHFVPQSQPDSLFINTGNGQFLWQSGANSQQAAYSSRAAVSVDFNNDGVLELLVSNNNGPLQLLENKSENPFSWVGLELTSETLFTSLEGGKVEIKTKNKQISREFASNHGFLSQGDSRVHIGLGDAKKIEELLITWPNQEKTRFTNVTPNSYYRVSKETNTLTPIPSSIKDNPKLEEWLGKLSENELVAYTNTLLKSSPGLAKSRLNLVWNLGSNNIRSVILQHAKRSWDDEYLPLVKTALTSHSSDLRILAIEILEKLELEISIAWLLPLLDDVSPEVQCATANAFTHFFNEEEAVIHRKKLAIPRLILLLKSGSSAVKVCASKALGAAENKRAIIPLLKMATSNEHFSVREAAVRALGLIRDNSVNKTIIGLANGTRQNHPRLVAQALIALKRLAEPYTDTLLNQLFDSEIHDKTNRVKALRTLTILLESSDGIVFSRPLLQRYVSNLTRSLDRNSLSADESIVVIRAMKAARQVGKTDFTSHFLQHTNLLLRSQALDAMLSSSDPDIRIELEKAISPMLATNIADMFSFSEKSNIVPSDRLLEDLARTIKEEGIKGDLIVTILSRLQQKKADQLVNILLSANLGDDQYTHIFNSCKTLNLKLDPPLKYHDVSTMLLSTRSRSAYVTCYLISDTRTSPMRQIQKGLYFKRVMADTIWSQKERNRFIMAASENDPTITQNFLVRNFSSFFEKSSLEQKINALRILEKQGLLERLTTELEKLMEDENLPMVTRLTIASFLVETDEENVNNYLNSLAQ